MKKVYLKPETVEHKFTVKHSLLTGSGDTELNYYLSPENDPNIIRFD